MIGLLKIDHGNVLRINQETGVLFEKELAQHFVVFGCQDVKIGSMQHRCFEGIALVVHKIQVYPSLFSTATRINPLQKSNGKKRMR